MITLTLRVPGYADVTSSHSDYDEAIRVLTACLALPASQVSGWSMS